MGPLPPGLTVIDEATQAQMESERKRVLLRMEKRVAHLTSQLASLTQKAARDAAQSAMRCASPPLPWQSLAPQPLHKHSSRDCAAATAAAMADPCVCFCRPPQVRGS